MSIDTTDLAVLPTDALRLTSILFRLGSTARELYLMMQHRSAADGHHYSTMDFAGDIRTLITVAPETLAEAQRQVDAIIKQRDASPEVTTNG